MDNGDACPYCQSNNIIKYGVYKQNQNYLCKSCGHRFASIGHIPRMHNSTEVITNVLNMYYMGMSLAEIQRNLILHHSKYISRASAYNWVERFTDLVVKEANKCQPKVGDTWILDEDYVRIDEHKPQDSRSGGNNWVVVWDVIDTDTCFLLASQVTNTQGNIKTMTNDVQSLLDKASKYACKIPSVVVTEKLKGYLDGIELDFGNDTSRRQESPFEVKKDNNLIGRFHGSLKDRTNKARRDLKRKETLIKFTDRWLLHYNFFRPHGRLNGQTPAQAAGINFPFRNWKDVVEQQSCMWDRNRLLKEKLSRAT